MYLSGFALLALVGGALAMKSRAFTPDNTYCFTSTPSATESCAIQSFVQHPDVTAGVNNGGSTSNPCASGSPFINLSSSCTAPLANEEYLPTQE